MSKSICKSAIIGPSRVCLRFLGFLAIDEVYELRTSRNDDIVPGIPDLQGLVYAERLIPLTTKLTSWNVRW